MDVAAAFLAGVSVGLGLGRRFLSIRAAQPDIPRRPSFPGAEERRRRDIPVSERGGAYQEAEWEYLLSDQEAQEHAQRTPAWRSMSWCHNEVLENYLSTGAQEVEIWQSDRKSWIVNFDKLVQESTTSGRVRPVRRRRWREQ